MHEMGIANSILEAVGKEVARYPGYRASRIGIRIGEFAGVDSESLLFCFDSLVKGSPFEPLELSIERRGGAELDLAQLELDQLETEEKGNDPDSTGT